MKLSIVVPVFNEKETIQLIIEKLENLDLEIDKEIIIVDDFSTDGSRDLVKKYEGRHKVIYHEKNRGKGRALRSGFEYISGDIVVIQDADLEYDPADLKKLLKKMGTPDVSVVYGSRRKNRDYLHARKSGHFFAIGGILLTWVTNLLYRTRLTDEPTCYKMFRAELLAELDLQCERFEFCPEFTAKVARKGIEIHEVQINYRPRHTSEGKKIKLKDFFEAVLTLIRYRIKG